MEDKKGAGMCREGCGCHGGCGDHWMSTSEHSIVRGFLSFFLLLFIFWIGLAIGEMRAYLKSQDAHDYRMIPVQDSWGDQGTYAPMMGGSGTIPQPNPLSPRR